MKNNDWWLNVSPQEYVRLIEGNREALKLEKIRGTEVVAMTVKVEAMEMLAVSKLGQARFDRLVEAVNRERRDGGWGIMDGGV